MTDRCPYLGLHSDLGTAFSYPSTGNYCYHCSKPKSPVEGYQGKYCLTGCHIDCKVFKTDGREPFPLKITNRIDSNSKRKTSNNRLFLVMLMLTACIIFIQVQSKNGPAGNQNPKNFTETNYSAQIDTNNYPEDSVAGEKTLFIPVTGSNQTASRDLMEGDNRPSVTISKTATKYIEGSIIIPFATKTITNSANQEAGSIEGSQISATSIITNEFTEPAVTQSKTVTPRLFGYELENQVIIDGVRLLIHQVVNGDNYVNLAKKYETTVEVLLSINYMAPSPLWVNDHLVVSPGMMEINHDLPKLFPYQIAQVSTQIDTLSTELGIEYLLMRKYNRCSDNCFLMIGDWVLIPYP